MKYQREAFERVEKEGENIGHTEERDSARPEYKTMGGRVVFGGGGITPDYIVKPEHLDEYSVQLRSKLVFLQFAEEFVDKHGAETKSQFGDDAVHYASDFDVTRDMLDRVVTIGTSKGVEFKKDLYEKDLHFIKAFAKAYIARSLWGNEGFSRVILREDVQFQKALSLFPEAEAIAKNIPSAK